MWAVLDLRFLPEDFANLAAATLSLVITAETALQEGRNHMAGLFAFNHKWLPTVVAEPQQDVSIARQPTVITAPEQRRHRYSRVRVCGDRRCQLSVTWGNPRVIGEV